MLRKPGYGRIFFEGDNGDNAGNGGAANASTTATPPASGESDAVTFTEAQQKEINRLIGNARKEGRTAAEQAAQDAKTAADTAAEQRRLEAAGEYETAKAGIEKERDDAKAERDTFKASLDAANVVIAEQVETLKKALPAELLTDYPQDGTPLDQLVWLKVRQAVYEVAKTAAGVAPNVTRLVATPGATGGKTADAMAEQMRGRISI